MTNFASVPFNKNIMLDLLLKHSKALKGISGEANMITVALIQSTEVFFISSGTFKECRKKVKEQHEIMNKVSR